MNAKQTQSNLLSTDLFKYIQTDTFYKISQNTLMA